MVSSTISITVNVDTGKLSRGIFALKANSKLTDENIRALVDECVEVVR